LPARVELAVPGVVHPEVDGDRGRLLIEDMRLEAPGPADGRIAADARVQKGQVPVREPGRQIELDVSRVLILLCDAVSQETHTVVLLKEERRFGREQWGSE